MSYLPHPDITDGPNSAIDAIKPIPPPQGFHEVSPSLKAIYTINREDLVFNPNRSQWEKVSLTRDVGKLWKDTKHLLIASNRLARRF